MKVGVPHRLVDARDPGIVDQDVDLAEGGEGGVPRLLHRGQIGDVDRERGDGSADLLGGFFRQRMVMIPDRDLGAGCDKTLGDGAPKPLRAAGDDRAAVVEIDFVHGEALFICRPHGEERALARVSNHEWNSFLILRDAATRPLLRMRS